MNWKFLDNIELFIYYQYKNNWRGKTIHAFIYYNKLEKEVYDFARAGSSWFKMIVSLLLSG